MRKKTLDGYWLLYKKHGLRKAIKFFYSWYYGQYKIRGVDLSKEHTLDVNGYKLTTIPNDTGISKELLKFRKHEPATTEIVSKALKKGMVCLDIGSNIGYYACLENKSVGKEGRVIAIEPTPLTYQYLKRNIENQNGNAQTFNIACADKDGTINFAIVPGSNFCRVISEGQPTPPEAKEIIKIPCKTVDSLVKELSLDKLDFLRMDIEGYEDKLFEGAKKTINKFKPAIQIEIHPAKMGPERTEKLLQYLQSEGYEVENYLFGRLDTPLVSSMKDAKKSSFEDLLEMLSQGTLPHNFLVFLKNQSKMD